MEIQTLPCGCVAGNVGDAFVIDPCSADCASFHYVLSQARKMEKEIRAVKVEGT